MLFCACHPRRAGLFIAIANFTNRPRLPVYWEQIADRLRTVRGVDSVAPAAWPLISRETAISAISTLGLLADVLADRLMGSDGWFRERRSAPRWP